MTRATVWLAIVLPLMSPHVSQAQPPANESHWGVSASVIPRWHFPRPLGDIWDIDTDMRGTELRVGIVRGSDLGGDVGFSFVKKLVDDDSVVDLRQSSCVQLPGGRVQCARGAYHVTRDAAMTGLEAHLFMPFGRIADRVQIGGTFAAGIARIDGNADRYLEHLVIDGTNVGTVTDPLGRGPFKESLKQFPQDWKVAPIGRAELSVGVVVRPGMKLRVSGGLNFPGYNLVNVHIHYLFGAQ
jgi:hypothetical protein